MNYNYLFLDVNLVKTKVPIYFKFYVVSLKTTVGFSCSLLTFLIV